VSVGQPTLFWCYCRFFRTQSSLCDWRVCHYSTVKVLKHGVKKPLVGAVGRRNTILSGLAIWQCCVC